MSFKPHQPKYSTIQVFESHQQKFAHYNRLLHARTHVPPKSQDKISSLTVKDPIKMFQLKNNNNKLYKKLIEIYQQPSSLHFQPKITKRKKKHRNYSHEKSMRKTLHSQFAKKEEDAEIKRLNIILFNRIAQTKPSVGNWKNRQNSLTTYGRLTRRRTNQKIKSQLNIENAYLSAFKNNLSTTEKKKKRKRNLKSSYNNEQQLKDQNTETNKDNNPESNFTEQYIHD